MMLLQVVMLVVLHVNAYVSLNTTFWPLLGLVSGAGSVSTVVLVCWTAARGAAANGSPLALEHVALALCCLTISTATTPVRALTRNP